MNPARSTLGTIAELADRKASGELICASDTVEIHIYFQRGRVAWATDSRRPRAFTRCLLTSAKIDVEVFREVLEACRREKRPLGETLVAWGVATIDDVRAALRYQVELALESLREEDGLETLFLPRAAQFADYDASLTFALEEVLRAPTRAPAPARARSIRAPMEITDPSTVGRLRGSLDGVLWSEVVEAADDRDTTARVPAELVRGTLKDGAELVAIRRSETTLAGVSLFANRCLWCLVHSGPTMGAIVTALASLQPERGADSASTSDEATRAPSGEALAVGDGPAHVVALLRQSLDHVSELHAVLVTDPSAPAKAFGAIRSDAAAESLLTLVERRATMLALPNVLDEVPRSSAEGDGVGSTWVMTVERHVYLFAAEIITSGTRRLVWLVADKRCSKGIGWGHLTSVARLLARAFHRPSSIMAPAAHARPADTVSA